MNELLTLVMQFQERVYWEIPFGCWADMRKHRADAKRSCEDGDRNYAKMMDETAEVYRKQAIEWGGKLLELENKLRLLAPELLEYVPAVDFMGEPPADFAPWITAMKKIEGKLRTMPADKTDEKTDGEIISKNNSRGLSPRAGVCGLAFKKAKAKNPKLKLKPFVWEWAKEGDSREGIYKSLLAHPDAYGKTDK